jgi:hypothetical protein
MVQILGWLRAEAGDDAVVRDGLAEKSVYVNNLV